MTIEKIFTEQPEETMWKELLWFSYNKNIENYLTKKGFCPSEDLIESISGSFLQGYEYFNASRVSNLHIVPLLLYYGATNLLYGMTNLLSGKINKITNHGMYIKLNNDTLCIADTNINFTSYLTGGIHVFSRGLNLDIDLTKYGKWSIKEFLSSIAEINNDYLRCYEEQNSFVLFLDIIETPNGIIEKIELNPFNLDQFNKMFSYVEEANKNYLRPSIGKTSTDQECIILRRKIYSNSISKVSFSGQPFLQVGHLKNGTLVTLPPVLNLYISLFAFSSLCRYHPEKWNPFVKNDLTGEKMIIESLMYFAKRMIPNCIINCLLSKNLVFVNEKYVPANKFKPVGDHEIKEIIQKEVQQIFYQKEVIK